MRSIVGTHKARNDANVGVTYRINTFRALVVINHRALVAIHRDIEVPTFEIENARIHDDQIDKSKLKLWTSLALALHQVLDS